MAMGVIVWLGLCVGLVLGFERYPSFERCATFKAHSTAEEFCYTVFPNLFMNLTREDGKRCPVVPPCEAELITQMSLDRFGQLDKLVRKWDGFISVAIVGANLEKGMSSVQKFLRECSCACSALNVHLVIGSPVHHPINLLRNVAFENGKYTSHQRIEYVSVYDIDFVPSPGLCAAVLRWGDQIERSARFSKTVEPLEDSSAFFRAQEKHPEIVPLQAWPTFEPLLIPPAFELRETSHFPETKDELRQALLSKELIRFHPHFEGQDVDLRLWKQAKFPFPHHPIKLLNEHYGFFSVKQFHQKNPDNFPLCLEQFFDRGFNKIMCYLHVRMRGFRPYFIPDGWLVHDYGVHHGQKKIPADLDPEDEEAKERFAGLYRETVIRHLLFQGFCELVQLTGWREVISPSSCDSLCTLSPSQKMIVGARSGKIQLRKCYSDILKLQGLRIEDQARLLASEYRMPYEEATEFGAKFTTANGEIPTAKLQALIAKADKRKRSLNHGASASGNNNNKYSSSSLTSKNPNSITRSSSSGSSSSSSIAHIFHKKTKGIG